jgi:hypothetical protein
VHLIPLANDGLTLTSDWQMTECRSGRQTQSKTINIDGPPPSPTSVVTTARSVLSNPAGARVFAGGGVDRECAGVVASGSGAARRGCAVQPPARRGVGARVLGRARVASTLRESRRGRSYGVLGVKARPA